MSSLAAKVEVRERQLEEKPDPWFSEPSGWLSKPDFKRKEQKLSQYKDGKKPSTSMMGAMMKKGYSRRFFVLNGMSLEYYREIDASTPAGAVRLDDVVEVTASVVPDAPPHAIDLRTTDQLFTLAADSDADMVSWALAIQSLIKKPPPRTDADPRHSGCGGPQESR